MAWSKESRHARGYGSAWDKLRLRILARDSHLCQCPDCLGGKKRLTPASEVHHKVPKADAKRMGWTQAQVDHPDNLQSVAKACHQRMTDEHEGRKPKARVGLDGWPVG
jgi:5-methylcytosine-specific restriction enzyme A